MITYIKENLFIVIITVGLIIWFIYLKIKNMKDSGYFEERKRKRLEKKALKESEKESKENFEEEPEPETSYFRPTDMASTLIQQKKHAIAELKRIDELGKKDFEYEKKLHEYYTTNSAEIMQRKTVLQKKYDAWQNYLANVEDMIKRQEELKEELK
jgi:glutamate synthase domain-containing protein 2